MTAAARSPVTLGHLLGGRVRHDQFRHGHRTGIEPVLLAASLPARPGDRVLEAGTGSGAGLLCLAARVAGVIATGVEASPDLATLARANVAANGFAALEIVIGTIEAFRVDAPFDHAFANPPWHDADATPSPDAARDHAHRADDGLLARWVAAMAAAVRPRGTLSLVIATASLPDAIAAYAASRCGSLVILPLWPRAGIAAKRVILRATRDGRGDARLLPGLVLHEAHGAFTPDADAILREGQRLAF